MTAPPPPRFPCRMASRSRESLHRSQLGKHEHAAEHLCQFLFKSTNHKYFLPVFRICSVFSQILAKIHFKNRCISALYVMFSCGQRNKQCSAARLRGFSGNRPFNRPMGHQFILLIPGKLFYLHFPLIASSFVSKVSYHTSRTGRLDFVYFARARNCAPSPFFPGHSSSRSRVSVRTFQKICIVHVFSISRRYRHPPVSCPDIPCSLTLYMLCKRQWDHGIHHRSPKA